MLKKLIILALLIVVVVAVLRVSTHTFNGIYTNKTLGFTFQVPKGEVVCDIQGGVSIDIASNCLRYGGNDFIISNVVDNGDHSAPYFQTESFHDWVLRIAHSIGDDTTPEILKETTINGMRAILIQSTYLTADKAKRTYGISLFLDKNPRIQLFSNGSLSTFDDIKNEGAHLLDRAKLVNSTPPTTGDFIGLLTIDYNGKDWWSSEYPFHHFTVYDRNGIPIARVEADRSSYFVVHLPAGKYFVVSKGKKTSIVVETGEVTSQDVSLLSQKNDDKRVLNEMNQNDAEIKKYGDLQPLSKLRYFFEDLLN